MGGEVHESAREEFTNILVNREGRWFTGPKEIINDKVISHFKQNLFRDEKGVYIYQTFKQFSEKGYITVKGPLLEVFRIDADKITLDSLDTVALGNAEITVNSDDEALYLRYDRLGCYASVPAAVAPDFAAFIEEEPEPSFAGRPLRRQPIISWC
jgi:hypothetical protein